MNFKTLSVLAVVLICGCFAVLCAALVQVTNTVRPADVQISFIGLDPVFEGADRKPTQTLLGPGAQFLVDEDDASGRLIFDIVLSRPAPLRRIDIKSWFPPEQQPLEASALCRDDSAQQTGPSSEQVAATGWLTRIDLDTELPSSGLVTSCTITAERTGSDPQTGLHVIDLLFSDPEMVQWSYRVSELSIRFLLGAWIVSAVSLLTLNLLYRRPVLSDVKKVLNGPGIYAVLTICATLYAATMLFGFAPSWPILVPDSGSYLTGSPSRPPAMYWVTQFIGLLDVWGHFAKIQFAVLYGSLLVSGALIARVSGAWLLVGIATASLMLMGGPAIHSFIVLPEALFVAGLAAYFAVLCLLLRQNRGRYLLVSCLFALGLTLLKPSGIVLVIPPAVIWVMTYGWNFRALKQIMLCIILPTLIFIQGVSVRNYASSGEYTFSNFGKLSWAGNVVWYVDWEVLEQKFPGLGNIYHIQLNKTREDLDSPTLGTPPALIWNTSALEAYALRSSNEYNPLLWRTLLQAVETYTETSVVTPDDIFGGLISNAITQNPSAVFYHLTAHYAAMWRYTLLQFSYPLRSASLNARNFLMVSSKQPENGVPRPASDDVSTISVEQQQRIPLQDLSTKLATLMRWPHTIQTVATFALLALSFLTLPALLLLRKPRVPPAFSSAIVILLATAAYYGFHTLFQVALSRYALIGVYPLLISAALLLHCFVQGLFNGVMAHASRLYRKTL